MSVYAALDPLLTVPDIDIPTTPRFSLVTFCDIEPRETRWLIDGTLPESDVVLFVGEEGIGKGLWWTHIVAKVTTGPTPTDVILIVAEDDPERTIRPRLDAAGADVSRVHIIVADRETLTGNPLLPTHQHHVEDAITAKAAKLVIIDPWISTVPGSLSIKDTQQARQALDPITRLARTAAVTVLLVTHTNRSSGTSRDRVNLTSALRQVARVMLLAVEDPEDTSVIYVGVDKANNATRGPAQRYVKRASRDAYYVEPDGMETRTITEIDQAQRQVADGRTSDKWPNVVAVADGGLVTRRQIEGIYADSPRPTDSANKAINRWIKSDPPRLRRTESGIYEVIS